MKYAMLSMLIPEEQRASFRKKSRQVMQDAANAYQWHLYYGLCANLQEDVALFNVLPVGSFPQYCKYPFILSGQFAPSGRNIGFCNVKLLRNYFKERKIYKALRQWCVGDQEPKTLFVYTISSPFVRAVAKVKRLYPSLRVCAIVADLPDMDDLSSKKGLLKRLYVKLSSGQAYDHLSCVDAFVLLTKHMAEYMQIRQPYCVVEGIASAHDAGDGACPLADGLKRIVYTGTLHRKFGVLHLLDAFRTIPDPSARLVICGIGDSEEEIRRAAEEDPRIDFRGQLPREEVLQLQREATVLVNPRQNNEMFTRYSFPSKTMEYLSSGVPVVAYKLDGIPDEYDEFLIYPKDNTSPALAEIISKVCSMGDVCWRKKGMAGRNYVLMHKNSLVQAKYILDFLISLQNN